MGQPNALVTVALAAYLVAAYACFRAFEPRRAVATALVGGWLFLPHFDGHLQFLLTHRKEMYVPFVVALASVVVDHGRWLRFRPGWFDLPVLAASVGPFLTALDNDLGTNEAIAAAIEGTLTWGAPWMLGRLYLGDERGLRGYAWAVVVGALVYVPLCLVEVKMSPQLHQWVYGFRTFQFDQALRFGGYRPVVFLQHGLAVGTLLATGALIAWWAWRTGALRAWRGLPVSWIVGTLLVMTLVAKSTGAIVLLGVGIAALELTRRFKTAIPVVVLALVPAAYAAARINGWNGTSIVETAQRWTNADRASSLSFRIKNEDMLVEKALRRPWLGWGRFGRALVYDEEGNSLNAVTDGLWIIAFGFTGLLGLVALGALLGVPPLLLLRRHAARRWGDPRLAAATACAVSVLLWAIDDLANAMVTPLFPAMAGGLASFAVRVASRRRAAPRPPADADADADADPPLPALPARDPGRRAAS